jgi:hypothetical protein
MTISTRSSSAAKVSGIVTSSGSLAASLTSPLATATVDVKDRIDWVIAQGWSVVGSGGGLCLVNRAENWPAAQ